MKSITRVLMKYYRNYIYILQIRQLIIYKDYKYSCFIKTYFLCETSKLSKKSNFILNECNKFDDVKFMFKNFNLY